MSHLDKEHRNIVMGYISKIIELKKPDSIAALCYTTGLRRSILKEVMLKENPVLYGELCQMVDLELPTTRELLAFLDSKNVDYKKLKKGLAPQVKFLLFVEACREYEDVKNNELVKIARALNMSRRTAYNYMTTLKKEYKKHA